MPVWDAHVAGSSLTHYRNACPQRQLPVAQENKPASGHFLYVPKNPVPRTEEIGNTFQILFS